MPVASAAIDRSIRRSVWRIVLPYAVFAALWILVSDRAVERLFPDPGTRAAFATLKGLGFVAITATLLWLLLRMELSRRANAERALQQTAMQLQRAQQVANVGSWTWDIPSGRLEWSDQMFRIFGIDRATFSGQLHEVVAGAIHPEDRRAVEEANRQLVEDKRLTALEYRVVRPDGTVRTVRAEAADLSTDAAGAPLRLSGIAQDITERKQLEQQFLRAQRTEAVAALASGIAHDLNNVLTPVMMIAPLLRARVHDPGDREMLDTLEQTAQRGSDIIRQLLTFARGEPGAKVPLPLRHLVREIDKIARDTFPRTIELHTDVPRTLWNVDGDVTQMHQVLMNLCLNAKDAMPAGGRLTLSAANVTLDDHEAVRSHAMPGRYVRLSVSDTGAGIATEHLDRIFDPFFTTKDVGKGTGLGLSSVLGIVRGHGGFVHVDTAPGQGTTFEVYLPASHDVARTGDADEAIAGRADGGLVLVVDDEAAVRDTLEQTLTAAGYRVLAAADGAEALAAYDAHASDLRVVLTDMMMPVMGGAALAAALRARGARAPVIVMSGAFDLPGGAASSVEGAAARLTKPFSPRDLLDALDRVLGAAAAPSAAAGAPAPRG